MKKGQMACQLYTLRDHLKTPAEIAATLKRVRKIGYEAVQVAGMGAIDDAELARILHGEGLLPCGSHEPAEILFSEPERVIERLRTLDCASATFPWPGGIRFDPLPALRDFIRKLNTAGKALHEAGIAFCYHNHHMEFRRVDGRTVLERIYAETDPLYLKAELDTYWVQFGGGDPADWCRKMKGRLVNLHMKDYAIGPENNVVFAEVGAGNLDWPGIVRAAEESGSRWYIVEQDTCPRDPFESVEKSLQFVREHLLRS